MRKRSLNVTLGTAVALVAAALSAACADVNRGPDHAQVCYENRTNRRVEDERCDDSTAGSTRWFYVPRGTAVPAVGESLAETRGTFARPTTGTISTVSRGGFDGRGASGS